ncbi:MAG: cytochrome c [Cytophagales bacterium]|nr:cytochrome c [Cytophagales bacterium]
MTKVFLLFPVLLLFIAAFSPADDLAGSVKRGEAVYTATCVSCHQVTGTGVPGVFPPLAKSDYLMGDAKRAIRTVLHGLEGEITVNGEPYNQQMPSQSHLSDGQVADVLNYVRNTWGNQGPAITPAQVKAERQQ